MGARWLTGPFCAHVCGIEHLDGRMGALATAQGGVISREQAFAVGATRRGIAGRLRAGRLAILHRGVYAVGHLALTPRGRAIGALLAVPGGILSHRTAGVVWVIIESDLARTDISLDAAVGGGARKNLRIHRSRSLVPGDTTIRHDLPITTVPRTLLDLADVCGDSELAQAVREARIRHHVQPMHLRSVIERSPGRRGCARLRRILEGPTGEPARSRTERAFLALIGQANLPRPEVNVQVGRFLCDFVWRPERLIIETDAWGTHGDRGSFEADRARDADLGAHGWTVHRFTLNQIRDQPVTVAATVARLIALRA